MESIAKELREIAKLAMDYDDEVRYVSKDSLLAEERLNHAVESLNEALQASVNALSQNKSSDLLRKNKLIKSWIRNIKAIQKSIRSEM